MIHINIKQWPYVRWQKAEGASNQMIGFTALVVMTVCGSTYNAFAKSLTDVLSPVTLVFLSELLTGFFVLLSFGTLPTLRKLLRLEKRMLLPLFTIGILNGILGPLLWFVGLHNSTSINASLFGNGEMVFMTLLAVLVLRESFTRVHGLSILTIVAGLAVIVLEGFTASFLFRSGDLFLLLSCMAFATGSIVFRKYLHETVQPHVVILCRSTIAVAGFFLVSPFISHPLIEEVAAFPLTAVPVLLGFGFVSRFLNLFSFYEAMEHLPVTTVSLSLNVHVIGSIAFAAWYLGESLYAYHYVGGAFIIAGALLLEFAGIHPTERHLESHLEHGNVRRM